METRNSGLSHNVTEMLRVPEEQLTPEYVFNLMHQHNQGQSNSGQDQKSKPVVVVKLGNRT